MFDISVDTVCTIINQARTLALGNDADGGNHDPDAHGRESLLHGDIDDDDLVGEEDFGEGGDDAGETDTDEQDQLVEFIDNLNDDEQVELVVISWIGRSTFTIDEWSDAAESARNEHTKHTGEYLLGQPRIADYLEEGLSLLGFSCEG